MRCVLNQSRPEISSSSLVRWIALLSIVIVVVECTDGVTQPDRAVPTARGDLVPMEPPDGVPDWVLADSSISSNGINTKGVVVVTFTSASTQASRTAAIDSVGGTVVGGVRVSDDGYYYIQVADGEGGAQLEAAIGKLSSLPQIAHASPEYRLTFEHYLRPQDGSGWSRANWTLSPDSVSGQTWALDAIAAPFAWGCATGDTATKVAVYDRGFDATEISTNTTSGAALFGTQTNTSIRHGTRVGNLIAARGDDGVGMTGVMWRAGLQLSAFANVPTPEGIAKAIKEAGDAGIPIINISSGTSWREASLQYPTSKALQPWNFPDSTRVLVSRIISEMMVTLKASYASGHMPLVIFSAGNDWVDASFGYPLLRDSFPNNILTVGSSTSSSQLATFSDTGSYIDVFAPGENVYTYAGNALGSIGAVSGTSYSAPLATGIAGLLRSFDSRLTPDSIRALIIQGGTDGGRLVRGTPVVNAYASLKRAARRSGAPLCGNHLWAANGKVYAQRATSSEAIIDVMNSGDAWTVSPMHGGHRIEYSTPSGRYSAAFSNGAWVSTIVADSETAHYIDNSGDPPGSVLASGLDTLVGGTTRSVFAYNHDGDSLAGAWASSGGGNDTVHVIVIDTGRTGYREVGNVVYPSPGIYDSAGTDLCVKMSPPGYANSGCEFTFNGGPARLDYLRVGFSPRGDRVFLAIAHDTLAISPAGSYSTCPESTNWTCRPMSVGFTTVRAELYAFDTKHSTHTQLPLPSGKEIWWIGSSGTDSTIVAALGSVDEHYTYAAEDWTSPWNISSADCTIQWRDGQFSATLQSATTSSGCIRPGLFHYTYPTPDGAYLGAGTISPNRLAPISGYRFYTGRSTLLPSPTVGKRIRHP